MRNNYVIFNADCLVKLDELEPESIDCIVTDPPYELNFMGKGWDNAGVSFRADTWAKCLRVLKPGGYLLAFGGSRTFHRIACAIEDAGFELRDTIMWLYGSGFPKSMNIGLAVDKKRGVDGKESTIKEARNEWKGWGTCLKPSFEPIIISRKSFKGALVDNVLKYGAGGLNIDECRIPTEDHISTHSKSSAAAKSRGIYGDYGGVETKQSEAQIPGRFPANTVLDSQEGEEWRRYFYCAKASKKDRDEGLEKFERKTTMCDRNPELASANMPHNRGGNARKNTHPTVKPTALMQYLIRLVAPRGATILDPFMGSGSTGKAVMYENEERDAGYRFVGIERDAEYCKIAEARIENARRGNGC